MAETLPCNTDHAPLAAVIDPETGHCFRCLIRLILEEMKDNESERDELLYGPRTDGGGALKRRLANVPVLSLILFKICPCGGSVVRAEWRWKRCTQRDGQVAP